MENLNSKSVKTVYFVRHGESEGNAGLYFQGPDTPLTEKGFVQARAVAERCSKLAFEVMYAATLHRVQQTATIISQITDVPFTSDKVYNERARPSSLIGKPQTDPIGQAMEAAWRESFLGGPRVEDGEDFHMVILRVKQIFQKLEKDDASNILIVTSGFLLHMILAYAAFGEALTPRLFVPIDQTFKMQNTGITVLRYNADKWHEHPWRVITWNDHAHLG